MNTSSRKARLWGLQVSEESESEISLKCSEDKELFSSFVTEIFEIPETDDDFSYSSDEDVVRRVSSSSEQGQSDNVSRPSPFVRDLIFVLCFKIRRVQNNNS